MRDKIATTFADRVARPDEDLDRRLAQIRATLSDQFGIGFDYYDPSIRALWERDASRWGRFVAITRQVYDDERFEGWERDWKIDAAGRLDEVRRALVTGDEWLPLLQNALGRNGNLTNWQSDDHFVKWANENRADAASALTEMWREGANLEDRIHEFSRRIPRAAISGTGTRTNLISFLLGGIDVTLFPVYKPATFQFGIGETGHPRIREDDEAVLYQDALGFLDAIAEESSKRGSTSWTDSTHKVSCSPSGTGPTRPKTRPSKPSRARAHPSKSSIPWPT